MSEPARKDPADLLQEFSQMILGRRNELRDRLKEISRMREQLERDYLKTQGELGHYEQLLGNLNETAEAILGIEQPASGAKETQYERIAAFMSQQRRPMTIAEIADATEISRSSVSAVLYRTHPEKFVRNEYAGSKPNTWLLKAAILEDRAKGGLGENELPF